MDSLLTHKKSSPGLAFYGLSVDNLTLFGFLFIPLALIIVFFVHPLLAIFFYSINDMRSLTDPTGSYGLANFEWVLNNKFFQLATRNTVIFVVASLLGQTVIGIFSALILNKDNLPGRTFFRAVLLFAWIMPELIVASIFLMIFGNNISIVNHWLELLGLPRVGWLNDPNIALFTLILVNIWKGIPLNIIIYLTALQGVNTEYYEAATLDGASAWQQFWALTFPFLLPTIVTTLILGTIWTANVFFLPFIMTGGGPLDSTLLWSLAIYRTIFQNLQLSRGAAMSVVVYLVLLVIGLVYYRLLNKTTTDA